MLRNLEVADAEGEIDRVDVFERGRKRDEVRQEDDGCDRSGERPGGGGVQTGFSRSAALRLPSR